MLLIKVQAWHTFQYRITERTVLGQIIHRLSSQENQGYIYRGSEHSLVRNLSRNSSVHDVGEIVLTRQTGRLRGILQNGPQTGQQEDIIILLKNLSRGPISERWGIVRGVLFDALGIADMQGLDRDPIDIIDKVWHLKAEAIADSARSVGIELLREQVSHSNTFFLDIDALRTSSGAVLVPCIVEARLNELKNACKGASSPITMVSTYYGFECTALAVRKGDWGAEFTEFLSKFAFPDYRPLSTVECDFDPSEVSFNNVSEKTGELLRTILVLTGPNSGKRAEAAEHLGIIADPRCEPYLRRATNDEYSWVRKAAVKALSGIAMPVSTPALIHALGDFDSGVQSEAVKGLVGVGPAAVVPLIAVLSEEPSVDYADALHAAEVSHPRSLDNLAAALMQRVTVKRALAAEALGTIGDSRAVPSLLRLSQNQDEQLRISALSALKIIAQN
jgi:hypothetical protein